MTEEDTIKKITIEHLKIIQKFLLEKSQSNEWVETARNRWLKDIETLQSAIITIEKL